MSPMMVDRLVGALRDTVTMVGASALVAALCGVPLALILVVSAPNGIRPAPRVHRVLAALTNGFRATPFIILLWPSCPSPGSSPARPSGSGPPWCRSPSAARPSSPA